MMYLTLTRSQVMALQSLVLDYVTRPGHIEVFIDIVRGNMETTPEDLLKLMTMHLSTVAPTTADVLTPEELSAVIDYLADASRVDPEWAPIVAKLRRLT